MRLIASCAALAVTVLLAHDAAAQSVRAECRDVTVSEGGRPKRTTMCKGTDGQWRPVDATAKTGPGQVLPANFRGQITYRGSYEVVTNRPVQIP